MDIQATFDARPDKVYSDLEEGLDDMRAADPDDHGKYFHDAMNILYVCLNSARIYNSDNAPEFATHVFKAGESALRMCGDRLLYLSSSPGPVNVAARANFQPFPIPPRTYSELKELYGEGSKDVHRARCQTDINGIFEQPALPEFNLRLTTCVAGLLMRCGRYMKAAKENLPDQADAEEVEWRKELLDYAVLAVLRAAQSLANSYAGRQVKVWGQIICNSPAAYEYGYE